MLIRRHTVLMAAVAILSASVVTVAQSVQPAPPPRPAPTVHLVAVVKTTAPAPQPPLTSALVDSPQDAPSALAIPIAPNLADTIDSIYIAVEPWVQYGFEVATAAVSWIPYVGWFAGQIMVLYNFGESMVASGVFNFTDWLRGDGGIAENLVDFGVDVGLAFVWLGLDEVAQFVPLPPFCCYPPRPPVQGPFLAADALVASTTETVEGTEDPAALATTDGADVDETEQVATNDANDLVDEQGTSDEALEQEATGESGADGEVDIEEADIEEADIEEVDIEEADIADIDIDDAAAAELDETASTDTSAIVDPQGDDNVDESTNDEADLDQTTEGTGDAPATTADQTPDATDAASNADGGEAN